MKGGRSCLRLAGTAYTRHRSHRPNPTETNEEADIMQSRKFSSAALATTAALLFSAVPLSGALAADAAKVKCEGVNACKGKSACSTATSACAGQNACKGQGYLLLTKVECDQAKAQLEQEKS